MAETEREEKKKAKAAAKVEELEAIRADELESTHLASYSFMTGSDSQHSIASALERVESAVY